jgi:hypothetical protein
VSKYHALLIAPDGDYVTDYGADTVEEVWERVDNGGSRWFFYPFAVVIRGEGGANSMHGRRISRRQRVVSAPSELTAFEGRTVGTLIDYLAEHGERILSVY